MALPEGVDDREVSDRAAEDGLHVMPLSSCFLGVRRLTGLVLGYGSLSVEEIPDAVRRLHLLL